jgi:preprotein translocase subunit SecA
MLKLVVEKIFGSSSKRLLKRFKKTVDTINALEKNYIKLSDASLKQQTQILRERLKAGETLDDILPNAFAIVREAAKRVLGQRHFDVQLLGGVVLHKGMIAEMKTGEGKTLVATLPCYLNALEGKGVHVVTVNDYLAKRDAEWMGGIYKFLGLSVGCIIHDMDDNERREAYACDITYGTNNEYGFDYLRDNMKFAMGDMVQRPFNFSIVDEVDSILIDEARTPLIISGHTDDNSEMYNTVDRLIPNLLEKDYEVDEKEKAVFLTEDGMEKMEVMLRKQNMVKDKESLYDIQYIELVHHIDQALRAHKLFNNEVDYIVRDGQVLIVDEFTGRVMEGRRFSDGLHQALEAKEKVEVQNENQTLASITYQNYFRMYPKLSGMTGTAMTEAEEFEHIYGLRSVEIPTNMPLIRKDNDDVIYKTADEKCKAIIKQIEECHKKDQPVLVGTISIEKSEHLSELLKQKKIPHKVLNAKYHEKEAYIVAQAGINGAITIATNMAGRGTDIMLGGNAEFQIEDMKKHITDENEQKEKIIEIKKSAEENKQKVLKAGGLYILGTERHESRRIDNQLRGRSGRQGDPGGSKFFLSLDDDLMRIFGSEKLGNMLSKLGLKDDEAIIHPWISKALETAQKKVEGIHYEIRKNILKYDDVVNEQRKIIFEQRKDIISAENVSSEIDYLIEEKNNEILSRCNLLTRQPEEKWNLDNLNKEISRIYGVELDIKNNIQAQNLNCEDIRKNVDEKVKKFFEDKNKLYGEGVMNLVKKRIFLMTLDRAWKDHLLSLDKLRKGINLRAYGQTDPLIEYKKDAFAMFECLIYRINEETLKSISRVKINLNAVSNEAGFFKGFPGEQNQDIQENRQDLVNTMNMMKGANRTKQSTIRNKTNQFERDPKNPKTWGKIKRNELCPCGSGKKYKQCCGKLE